MGNQTAEHSSIQVLEIQNLLNEFENRAILQDIEQKISEGFHNFVLDLAELKFLNSIGINFLLNALRKSQQSGGTLALANISNQVEKLLEITKLRPYFTVQPNVNDAIKSIND